jgi:hypothetical protein
VGVRFVDPIRRDDAVRVRRFCDEALREIGVELDVPVSLVDALAPPDGLVLSPTVAGWANKAGVTLCHGALDRFADDRLRALVIEETVHFWTWRTWPHLAASPLHSETLAGWFVARACGEVWVANTVDSTNRYQLGRLAGPALAGMSRAREALEEVGAVDVIRMLDRLDGTAEPQDLARQLVGELGGR